MSDASIIKEFLVGLGFKVDGAGLKKFETGIKMATKVATELGKGAAAAAASVEVAVTKISKGFEDLYWASVRIGSSVENIRSMDYAVTQMGGSAQGARQAMENIAEFMRSNPGGERFIGSLGVATRDTNGELRDTAEIMKDLGQRFAAMPYFAAKVRANMLGIDERTLQAMIRGTDEFADRYHRMAQTVGVDQQAAAAASHAFMNDMRDLLVLLQLVGEKVILAFQPVAHDIVTALIAAHEATHGWSTAMVEIAAVLGPVLWLLKPIGAVLLEAVGGMEALGAAAAAVGVFLSGPVGWIAAIVAGIVAFLATSKKFRDEFAGTFDSVAPAIQLLQDAFSDLWQAVRPILGGLAKLAIGARDAMVDAFGPEIAHDVKVFVAGAVGDIVALGEAIKAVAALLRGDWRAAWEHAKAAGSAIAHPAAAAARQAQAAAAHPAPAAPSSPPASAPGGVGRAAGNVGDRVRSFLQGRGFSAEQARGIAAGIYAESNGQANAVNPTSGAFGIGQWLGSRKKELFRRYGPNPTLDQQLEYLAWELSGGDRGGAAVRASSTASGALNAYVSQFMRPGPGTAGDLTRGAAYLQSALGRSALATTPTAVNMNQKTEINIHGVSDPQGAGRAIAAEQGGVNGGLVRHLKSALQ